GHNYRVIGRLKPGVSIEQAQSQLTALSERLQRTYPDSNTNAGAYVTTLTDFTVRRVKTSLYILLAAVAVVLLIACANVANLLLARGSARVRELAIRASLGATEVRLVRQLLSEAAILSAFGCGLGILLAYAVLPVLVRLAPSFLPRLNQIRIDPTVLLFGIGAACVTTFLFGLAPALQARRTDPNIDLRAGSSRTGLGGSTGALRQALVVAEVALSLVLLVSAGLLLKSFVATLSVDLGFRPEKLLMASLSVPSQSGERVNQVFYQPLLARLSQTSGVASAALTHTLPGDSATRSDGAYITEGQTMKDFTVSSPQAGFSVVSPGYFQTLRIPLLAGRDFSDRDGLSAPPVAIIGASLARRAYPHQNAVGRKILCGLDLESMKWMQIVGIVGDVRMDGPTTPPTPEIYMVHLQHPRSELSLIVNAGNNPMAFTRPLRREIRALDPEVSIKLTTMENHLAGVVSTPRFGSTLVSAFAGLAILLAAIGIYGVMAYSVVQRTSEIGLRIALGADRRKVLGLILSQAIKLSAVGLVIGAAGAIACGRLLKSQLFEVSPSDPAIYALMVLLLALLTLAASYIPAWRACRIEPLEALRQE
ncbi:MAG: FtsX-like permease family protein, partial [Acidobacteriaceae bacterium]|nr:FtsX-like permease family protein [Acidobacteriaceae bacterium]